MYEIVDIILTEVKRIDLEQGILQNLFQQLASQELLVASAFVDENLYGKRFREEDAEANYSEIAQMPTYGIESTDDKWIFLKFIHRPTTKQIYRSDVLFMTKLSGLTIIKVKVFGNDKEYLPIQFFKGNPLSPRMLLTTVAMTRINTRCGTTAVDLVRYRLVKASLERSSRFDLQLATMGVSGVVTVVVWLEGSTEKEDG
eukprot:scaffold1453_cov204-Ochromonas_danica.AAC.1